MLPRKARPCPGRHHIVIDDPLDQQLLNALKANDTQALHGLPREQLKGGASEILNWVALDGAVDARC